MPKVPRLTATSLLVCCCYCRALPCSLGRTGHAAHLPLLQHLNPPCRQTEEPRPTDRCRALLELRSGVDRPSRPAPVRSGSAGRDGPGCAPGARTRRVWYGSGSQWGATDAVTSGCERTNQGRGRGSETSGPTIRRSDAERATPGVND